MKNKVLFYTTALVCGLGLSAPTAAWAEKVQPIDVPAQPLADAITELGRETGLRIAANANVIEGKTSNAVQGPMEPMQALRRLLEGTGLGLTPVGENGSVVTRSFVSQDAGEVPFDLGTLVLRGELIDRTIQDSQTSAVVVSGGELEERGETTVGQVLDRIPGVSNVNGLVIRGITDDGGLGNGTTSSTISVTTDGIRLSDFRNVNRTEISTWDVEQVEVFRGSQSTQSGRNALAGAIVVEGIKPQFFQEYKFRLGVTGNEDFDGADPGYLASFVLNTPLIENQLAFRLSVDRAETSGFEELQTIRAGLLYEPTDRLSFGLTYSDIDNGGDSSARIQSPRLNADYQISDALTFSSRTQYTNADVAFQSDFGFERERDYETTDQEFRLILDTDNLRAVGGLFYTNIDELSVLRTTGAGPLTGSLDDDIETKNYAIYGEVEYDLSPQWTLVAGLRYDVEEVKSTQTLDAVFGGIVPVTGSGSLDTSYDALLPKLGVVYRFDENRSLGFTYQRGYRAGGLGVNVPLTGGAANFFEFDPEFTDTFELAYRSESSAGNRILNANVYYTKWTDQQVQGLAESGLPIISNASESDLWGAEVDYRQLVNDSLVVLASVAFSKAKYGDGTQFSGNTFPFAPELVALFGANYAFDNGVSIGGDVNYTSSTFSDAANTPAFENDDYWVTNLYADYTFENGAMLTAYARNLFDEEYTTQQTAAPFVGFGPRREYGLYLTMQF